MNNDAGNLRWQIQVQEPIWSLKMEQLIAGDCKVPEIRKTSKYVFKTCTSNEEN